MKRTRNLAGRLRPALAAGRFEAGDALRTLIWGYDAAVFLGTSEAVPH